MENEWETVHYRPGKEGAVREIDVLRKRYADHRETLERLAADAPTEHLARRYRELVAEVDAAVARLESLEGEAAAPPDPNATGRSWSDAPPYAYAQSEITQNRRPAGGARALLILLAGLAMIAVLGVLFWRWLEGAEPAPAPPRPETAVAETAAPPEAPQPPLTISPAIQDYGAIRRGARAARQFEIENHTDAVLPIEVKRSQCRCLWFEYADTIPPRGTTTLTVTVDAAKVQPGRLEETVEVTGKGDRSARATFAVTANVGSTAAQ